MARVRRHVSALSMEALPRMPLGALVRDSASRERGNQTIRVVAVGSNLVSVTTYAGRVGGPDPSLGPLPQAVGSPVAIALTAKPLYFVIGGSILFIDR
jgi:hypothetical protein